MDTKLHFIYKNELNMESFIHMLDDATECYKFYWLDALLSLFSYGKTELSFDELLDRMIVDVWYSVVEYHLHLGPKNTQGEVMNSLERAVLLLEKNSGLSGKASEEEILAAIREQEDQLKKVKDQLIKNVPYRALAPFMPEITGNDKIWNSTARVIEYIHGLNVIKCLPYEIQNGKGRQKMVRINEKWQPFFRDNYATIHGWIELKKVRYLQGRNPGVPGIIYKLEPENTKLRKLRYVRELWTSIMDLRPVYDIYSEEKMSEKNFDIDHFVPWSFVANDELWNLMPMESSLNSSKSNRLPKWNPFFKDFAYNQYILYGMIHENANIHKRFEVCYGDNLHSIWAGQELYRKGNTEEEFYNILEKNMLPVYESARRQGYEIWEY